MSPPPSEPTHNLEEVLAKAMAIEEQYKQSWSLTELELRIALLENALASEPGILNNHQASDKQSSLHDSIAYMLAKALKDRYHHTDSVEDVAHQIALLQPLVENLTNSPLRNPCLRLLGGAYRDRAVLNGSKNDIQEALKYHGTIRDTFEVSPDQPGWMLSEMGNTLRIYAQEFSVVHGDIDLSCALLTRSLDARWEDDYDKSQAYLALSAALRARYVKAGVLTDIEGSLDAAQQCALLCHPGHRDRFRVCQVLGTVSVQLSMQKNNRTMLDKGIEFLTEGALLKKNPVLLASLAYGLMTRFSASGSVVDLEQAIQCLREGLDICSSHASYRCALLTNYATALNYHFEISHDLNKLDEVVLATRECASLTPLDHMHRRNVILSLAGSLARHSTVYGTLESLDEALELSQEQYDQSNSHHPEYTLKWSHSLAEMYLVRYSVKGNSFDARKALVLIENSIGCIADNNLSHSRLCGETAYRLYTLYKNDRSTEFATLEIIETSIMYWQRALDSCPAESSWRLRYLSGLALAKTIRFRLLNQENDVDLALQYQQESLLLSHNSQPYNCINAMCGMALIHLLNDSRYYDLDKALDYLEIASKRLDTYAQDRMEKVVSVLDEFNRQCHLERLSSHQCARLLSSYQNAIDEIPRCAFVGLHSRGQLLILRLTELLASGAAQIAMLVHCPTRALELLEQGRATFWAQYVQLRTHIASEKHSIFEELRDVARRLQPGAQTSDINSSSIPHIYELHSQSQRKLGLRFEELVVQAREVPGFERFLLPKTFSLLAQAAARHPFLVLLEGSLKCYGIIMLPGKSSPTSVELKHTTNKQLVTMLSQLKTARSQDRGAVLRAPKRAILVARKTQNFCTVNKILRMLWSEVVEPVIKAARLETSDCERSRLYLCCTGIFSHLPVHAAGIFTGNHPISLAEHAFVSYTPTITALITASQNALKVRKEDARVLISTIQCGFQWTPLPSVEEEAQVITAVVPPESILLLTTRDNEAKDSPRHSACAKEVLEHLPQATILHMACHGYQDQTDSLASGFVMSDKMLTVEQLLDLELPKAQFAFLSACETAKTNEAQPDQAVNLASTLLFAGFRSVIGTMWSMNDVDGPVVARVVYEAIFGGSGEYLDLDSIPQALDTAVRMLRQSGVRASRWATYVHMGA